MRWSLPGPLRVAVEAELEDWRRQDKLRRLWARDATLWTGSGEERWLGWLDVVSQQRPRVAELTAFGAEVRAAGFTDALLLGMGGSSLAPEVLASTFGQAAGWPRLHVLDSTDPAQVSAFEARADPARTLFIVSSKSGTTLEPDVFRQYFFENARRAVGAQAGSRFIAITDPGSKLQQVAEADGFRRVCFGRPDIGGRYSALSDFGLVPAAVMGLDVARLLERAEAMVRACGADVAPAQNPGLALGVLLGVAATRFGRDKLTLMASPRLLDLGAWLEQLLAESTGKQGKALIPVDREPIAAPAGYGDDRLFVHLRLATEVDPALESASAALVDAGFPVATLELSDVYELGAEFFRWEVATAVAGALLGINPFDQPDVEASKIATRTLTAEYERTGALPLEAPLLEEDGIRLYADAANAEALRSAGASSLAAALRAHLGRVKPRDYIALLAYVEMNAAHQAVLQAIRQRLRDRKRVATCLGFGPRFLHSTGQAYKGGPNTGVFLQVTAEDARDLAVPGRSYSFGVVKAAQARGDLSVLGERHRRALRIHLPADVPAGLARLEAAVRAALE